MTLRASPFFMGALALSVALASACSASRAADDGGRVTFVPCEGDYECATVEVPVDYAKPGGPKIGIALLRAPARDPAARLGAVVVNPGGPGLAFVERLATTYPVLSAGFATATARFDVVTFDWRGVGRSASIGCADDALFDRIRAVDLTLEAPGSQKAIADVRASLTGGCLGKADPALLGAMNTENAARDLDRIRAALGEEKLNYLGFSYGTWLGATYATLFPERVRAFALDSPTVLRKDLEADILEQAASYNRGLQRLFEACARETSCALRGSGAMANDPASVGARLDAIVAKLKARPGGLAAGARSLSLVDLELALADGLRNGDFAKLAAELASADGGDASALLDRADLAIGRDVAGHYDTSLVGLLAIACVDEPLGAAHAIDGFASFVATAKATHPRGATAAALPWALCTDWPFRRAGARVEVAAPSAPRMLVVAGRYDPITSYKQGPEMVRLLGNGSSLVTYEGDGHAASTHSACIRDLVTAFLLDPAQPPAKASCPAE